MTKQKSKLAIVDRSLTYDGKELHKFRSDAKSQIEVLRMFESQGWPSRINNKLFEGNRSNFHAEQKKWSAVVMKLNRNMRLSKAFGDPEGAIRFGTRYMGSMFVCYSEVFGIGADD